MSKRRAGNELTRDNWDEEEEKVEAGRFQMADESTLKNRIVKKAKRTIQRDESGEIKPIFSGFSGFSNTPINSNSKQAFSFLSKCNEKPNESGNHPSASTINSMTTSSSLTFSENNCSKSSTPNIVNPVKVMKLNEAFVKFVTDAVQKNPYCVLTPTLKDYEKQVAKFVTLIGSKTNTSDSSMASSKESPQVSSFENIVTRTKDLDEIKNNSVNVQSSDNFVNPISNTTNNGSLFCFGNKTPTTNFNESCKSNLKPDKKDEEVKEEINLESKSSSISLNKTENTPIPTFKFGDFKFDKQSLSSPSSNKFAFQSDEKTSPSNKPAENKSNAPPPSFSFGSTVPSFVFKPMDQQSDNKPFFSFGSKPSVLTPNPESNKNTENQESKDEQDEDQPPVVNFTPIKENDAIFESKSKLYCLKNGKYEELGIGQLYLKPIDDKKIQLIMRNDSALGTIMVNTLLNESVNFTKRNSKNIQLICVLDPTKSPKPQTVLFKFKDSQITDSFESELNKLKN